MKEERLRGFLKTASTPWEREDKVLPRVKGMYIPGNLHVYDYTLLQ